MLKNVKRKLSSWIEDMIPIELRVNVDEINDEQCEESIIFKE